MISLKNVLLLNGISSGATGVLLVAFARFIANLFQVTSTMTFISVGIFLIVFATVVIWIAMDASNQTRKVQMVIALDVIWTAVSFIIVILFRHEISMIGNVLILAIALWVAAMAFLQTKYLKQITL